ncbi:MAG TPA: glutathione transferase GstA [Oceanospirillales bacterium]|nr:glutathione transferase GstA [Oceanospirillales bacterium]
MKLYYSPGACSQAPHIILNETNAEFELVKVDLATKITEHGEDFTKINPNGYVPALQMDNGEVLTEGVAIMQYLADLAPEKELAPKNATFARAKLQERLNYLTSELHKGFVPLFSDVSEQIKAGAKGNLAIKFSYLDSIIKQNSYLADSKFSIADAYLFVISNWTKMTGIDLSQWQNVSSLVSKVFNREAVQKTLNTEGLLA